MILHTFVISLPFMSVEQIIKGGYNQKGVEQIVEKITKCLEKMVN